MKKLLSVLLAILCMMSLTTVSFAVSYDGDCGENLKWQLDTETGTLTISGEGDMEDYGYGDAPWDSNRWQINSITISEGVTSIGDYAFCYCTKPTEITIPDSVTRIGNSAFYQCQNLADITIGNGVEEIGSGAFSYTAYYKDESNWENDILYIGNYLIDSDYPEIKTYEIKEGTRVIGGYALNSCSFLRSVTIPDSVVGIGERAFAKCWNLADVTIPDSVKRIGEYAFGACVSLKSVTIPDNVISIGDKVFGECVNLEEIIVSSENPAYMSDEYGVLYTKDKTKLLAFPLGRSFTEYVIPASATCVDTEILFHMYCAIDIEKFIVEPGNECLSSDEHGVLFNQDKTILIKFPASSKLTHYTVPDTVKTISQGAFNGCNNLTDVVISEGVETCADFLFCKNLKTVTIPSTLTIYEGFVGSSNLEKIIVAEGNENLSTDENGILYNKDKTIILYAPAKNIGDSYVMPSTVEEVSVHAFIDCRDFSLTLSDSLEDLDYCDFITVNEFVVSENHPTYTTIDGVLYNKDVTELIKYPVDSDRQLLVMPESVKKVNYSAFYGYSAAAVFGELMTSNLDIGDIRTINFPENLTLHSQFLVETFGVDHIYLCGSEVDSETLDEYHLMYEEARKQYELMGELVLNEYPDNIPGKEVYKRLYEDQKNAIPYLVVCDGDHTELHPYTETVTTEATCTAEGVMTYTCVCGDTYTELIPVKDHETVPFEQKSTCSVAGYRCDLCTACGENFNTEELELLPHSWGEWVVETEPTTELEGVEKRVCSECGETETKSIPTIEEPEEPTIWDKIAAFFENIADFFNNIFEWFANLFKV